MTGQLLDSLRAAWAEVEPLPLYPGPSSAHILRNTKTGGIEEPRA